VAGIAAQSSARAAVRRRLRLSAVSRRGPILAFDAGSPRASVALATGDGLLAQRDEPREPRETDLLRSIDAVLTAAGASPRSLGGVVAIAGPGSFTGVRVACATARALSQAWNLPATGISTLVALAISAPEPDAEIVAVVDALRGEWFVQSFGPAGEDGVRSALGAPALWRPEHPLPLGERPLIGFFAARLAAVAGGTDTAREPTGLAAGVARAAADAAPWPWDEALLSHPLHLRAPATTRPRH